jgi:putative nucleotidyltransferase with HDIG domain
VTTVVAAFVTEDADAAEHRAARDKMRDEDRAMYRRLVGQLRTLSQRVAAQDTPDVTEASAMVGSILGRLMEDQSAVLGLATIRSHSEATLFHSISVMIYALALGRQLGLPEEGLTSLGVSALMHDIGKAAFDGADPEQVRAAELLHPTVGAEILAALPDDDKAPMLVAYEHHMGVDGSGFPERAPDYFGHPFSRMVAVANRYENLVKPLGSAEALTPERAVARLMAESNGPLDPIFTRLFIKAVGVLPIGTLVRLSDHTIAVVARVDGESDPLAPVVRPVYDADGAAIVDPEDIDLSTDERYVAEAIDQDTLRVEVSEHL